MLQVNHPRWDPKIAYFSAYQVDEKTGEPAVAGYDPGFDTLEVYNGDDAYNLKKVEQPFADWLHLLGAGHRYAATGSSDSHNLAFLDPGLPRTLIHHGAGGDDASDVRAPVARVIEAIKAGRSIVTSGPILEASVDGAGPGETARGVGKRARLRLRVRAAPWIDVTWLEVLMGGRGERVHSESIKKSRAVVRLDKTVEVPVNSPTFLVVTVKGERGLPNVSRDGTKPFAFTNPIWIEP